MSLSTLRLPLFSRVATSWRSSVGTIKRLGQDESRESSYRPRHAAVRSIQPAHAKRGHEFRIAGQDSELTDESTRESQLVGLSALLSLSRPVPAGSPVPATVVPGLRPRALALLKDRALQGALALMVSAVAAGGLGFIFWALTAHHETASAVGSVSAEVSSITFLASASSLNLINIFARFLPLAGWRARRLILTSYGGAALVGLLAAVAFLLTPLAKGLVLGGGLGRIAFAVCVVINSVFMIQDGGLIGFGRFGWVPIENILVASARLALLPISAMFLTAPLAVLWSWGLPMAAAVLIVNVLIVGPLAGRQAKQRPSLPTYGELGRLVAVDSVTTAIYAAMSAFLPALVTHRLGASQGGYFYVPWIITTMISSLLFSILLSMVRESVANPEKVKITIPRSMGLTLVVVLVVMTACLGFSGLVLAPLGHDFAIHGSSLLRWTGLAVPATAIDILYMATCLVRRRPWPVFAVNLTASSAIVGGVLLLRPGVDIDHVSIIYCIVQWVIAVVVCWPTIAALRVIRHGQESL